MFEIVPGQIWIMLETETQASFYLTLFLFRVHVPQEEMFQAVEVLFPK